MLTQLLYISEFDNPISDMSAFMANVREKNKQNMLSSILLSTDKYYMHLIEGNRDAVNNLYNRIVKNPAHKNCTLLRYIDIKVQEFGGWHAEYVHISEFDVDGMNLLTPTSDIDIKTITSTRAVAIFRRIHAHLQVRAEKPPKPPRPTA